MKQSSPIDKGFTVSLQDAFIPADFRWFFQGKAMRTATAEDENLVRTVDIDNGKHGCALIIFHG